MCIYPIEPCYAVLQSTLIDTVMCSISCWQRCLFQSHCFFIEMVFGKGPAGLTPGKSCATEPIQCEDDVAVAVVDTSHMDLAWRRQ